MTTIARSTRSSPERQTLKARSLDKFFSPLDGLARQSSSLTATTLGSFTAEDQTYALRRYLHVGPSGGDAPIRLGIFAGIHGDEPAPAYALRRFIHLLEDYPEIARGYCLFFYPICNPTGFEDDTRHSRLGHDLNRQFWRESADPEVALIERELLEQSFHGLISLHADDTSDGLYGFVAGATLTKHLIRPALLAAGTILPLDERPRIDGFDARDAIIRQGYEGVLGAPPTQRPRPFDIILETPQAAPQFLQEQSLLIALDVILQEYRKLIAYAANL
jgi:murein peptide amidase A